MHEVCISVAVFVRCLASMALALALASPVRASHTILPEGTHTHTHTHTGRTHGHTHTHTDGPMPRLCPPSFLREVIGCSTKHGNPNGPFWNLNSPNRALCSFILLAVS